MPHPSVALPALGYAEATALVGEPVHSVTPVGQGVRSRVYRVETEEGAVRIVRLTPRGSGRLEREAWVRTQLRKNPDVPLVAEIAATEPSLSRVADVVTMAEVPGTTMYAAMRSMFENEARELYARFGAGVAAIHAVDVQGFGLIDAGGHGPYPSWPAAFGAIAEAALTEARASPLVDLADEAEAVIHALSPALAGVTRAQLIHGDAQPMNVQVHRGKIVAFFDFEFAMGADPRYELAAIDALFEPASGSAVSVEDLAQRRAAFLAGYAQRAGALPAEQPDLVRLYRLVHALRGAEFLSVVGPQLAAPVREQTAGTMRSGLRRWLEG